MPEQLDDGDGGITRPIDMAEFGRRIAARKAELGLFDPLRNAGKNRQQACAAQADRRAGRGVVNANCFDRG